MIVLNGKEVVFGSFPNKECYLKMEGLPIKQKNYIQWTYENDTEFFKLALLKSHINSLTSDATLHIYYMPYSRMDKVNGVYVMACPVAAKLINDMGFTHVSVREPHSQACMRLLNYSSSYLWTSAWIDTLMKADGWDSIFFPDFGAKSRYGDHQFGFIPNGYGVKKRDYETSHIETYKVIGDVGKRVLIIDDLCSRGGTFVEAAKLLRSEKKVQSVGLLVATCEENVHTGELFDYVDRLYTSKDCILSYHPRITLLLKRFSA